VSYDARRPAIDLVRPAIGGPWGIVMAPLERMDRT